MRVLVIPEDFRKDQYMLQPIITAMMAALGKPKTKVIVCKDPLLGGVSEALKWENIQEIINRYKGMVDLFLLCVDRDGKSGRKKQLDKIEEAAEGLLTDGKLFLAENAWQELEVWVLAGHDLSSSWQEIRNEINPKEAYFIPFAAQRNVLDAPGEGRKILAEEAARRYNRIRQLCQEDIGNLESRIQSFISS
jgi:hypothetical protein